MPTTEIADLEDTHFLRVEVKQKSIKFSVVDADGEGKWVQLGVSRIRFLRGQLDKFLKGQT